MSRLSVALCTYNGGPYLDAQLESIAAQTRPPDEVVVRDDGSTDDTLAIARAFAERAPFPVRVVASDRNLGYVKNFEAAISACTGDLVALSDQDDVWLPHKLAVLERALGNNPRNLLAFSDAHLVGPDLEPLGRTMWEAVGLDDATKAEIVRGGGGSPLLKGFFVTGATVCFRASLAERALPIDLPHWHDAWLAMAAVGYGRVVVVDESLVLYRQHGLNAIGAPRLWSEGVVARVRKAVWKRATGQVPLSLRATAETERVIGPHLCDLADYAAAASRRFADSPVPGVPRFLSGRAAHVSRRASMPRWTFRSRAALVLRGLVGGDYHRFDIGARAALLDIRR